MLHLLVRSCVRALIETIDAAIAVVFDANEAAAALVIAVYTAS